MASDFDEDDGFDDDDDLDEDEDFDEDFDDDVDEDGNDEIDRILNEEGEVGLADWLLEGPGTKEYGIHTREEALDFIRRNMS